MCWGCPQHGQTQWRVCLQACGHAPDARLATTLIRVCSQHGQALAALGLYDWMRAGRVAGGGALTPTVFTYTAAMRAALAGGLLPRALQVGHPCSIAAAIGASRCRLLQSACIWQQRPGVPEASNLQLEGCDLQHVRRHASAPM